MTGAEVGPRPAVLSARQALEFLDNASGVLARSLDYELTLSEIAQLAVPEIADWCAVDIVDEDGSLRQITSGHPDPAQERLLLELRRRYRESTQGSAGVAHAIRTGESELVSDVATARQPDLELSAREQELYERLGPRSYVIVPLVTRGRTLGALTLLSTRPGRHYGPADCDFAQHLARRFALAIDNARLFAENQAARRRAEFLLRAGETLSSSLDYEGTLRNVAQLAVPDVVDWCAVHLREDTGAIRQVAVAHADPAREELARELDRRLPPDPAAPTGVANVIRTAETEHIPEITDELIDALVPDPEVQRILKGLGLRASIVAPLVARGRAFGAVTFVSAESGRRFTREDVEFVEECARRAGTAIENARLYTERSRIAHTLQAALLPKRLPEIPCLDLAVAYRAAGELNEVGGDFYDVFPGMLLGAFPEVALIDSVVQLDSGDGMLWYTDGVTEAGRPERLLGTDGLAAALASPPRSAAAIVSAAEAAAVQAQGGTPRDDMALVAVLAGAPDRRSAAGAVDPVQAAGS